MYGKGEGGGGEGGVTMKRGVYLILCKAGIAKYFINRKVKIQSLSTSQSTI